MHLKFKYQILNKISILQAEHTDKLHSYLTDCMCVHIKQ